jgi:hypothetical protein
LRRVQHRRQRPQKCVLVIGDTRGHLMPHLRTLLPSWPGCGATDTTFRLSFHDVQRLCWR